MPTEDVPHQSPFIRASVLKLAFFPDNFIESSPVAFPAYASAFTSVNKTCLACNRMWEFRFLRSIRDLLF